MKRKKQNWISKSKEKIWKFYKIKPQLILPSVYIAFILIGIILLLVNYIFPAFNWTSCINLGGIPVCTLIGVYIATVASLPGYIVLGGVFRIISLTPPLIVSYLLLLAVNLAIYYLLGVFVQRLKLYKNNTEKLAATLIIFVFALLGVILLLLKTL